MKRHILPALALAIAAAPALAHEGHAEEASAPLSIPLAARAQAETDQIELLAVFDAGKLTLYVDRYSTNEPISEALVEVEGAAVSARATPVSHGVYELPAPLLASPGTHALTVSVQARELSDLLTLSFTSPAAAAAAERPTSSSAWTTWAISAGLLALASLLVLMRRMRWKRRHPGRKS